MNESLTPEEARPIADFLMASLRTSEKFITAIRRIHSDLTFRLEGQTWFVPDTFMPGETVRCNLAPNGAALLIEDHTHVLHHGPHRATWAIPLDAQPKEPPAKPAFPFQYLYDLDEAARQALLPLVQSGLVSLQPLPCADRAFLEHRLIPGLMFLRDASVRALVSAAYRPGSQPDSALPPGCPLHPQTIPQPHQDQVAGRRCPGCRSGAAPMPGAEMRSAAPRSGHPAEHPSRAGNPQDCHP